MNVQLLLALRYLNGRKLRSFLTMLAVLFGVLVIFGVNIILPTLMSAFQTTLLAGSEQVDLTISHRSQEAFPVEALEAVRSVEGIRVAHGLFTRTLSLPVDYFDQDPRTLDKIAALSVVGLDAAPAREMRLNLLEAGRFLNETETGAVVISASLAQSLGLQLGDRLSLPMTQGLVDLTIVGIRPPRALPGNEEVQVSLADAQRMFDAPGKINTIEANFVSTTDDTRRAEIQQAVERSLGADYVSKGLETGNEFFASMQMAQGMFTAFGFLALFMGGFIIFNTFRTLVTERRRDIGMLRAVGASRRTIIGIILIEGLIQGGLGTLAGLLFGYLLASAAIAGIAPFFESMIRVRMSAPVVTPGIILVTLSMGIGTTLAAGLLPALSAGRISPLDALRPSLAGVAYRRGLGISAIAGIGVIAVSLLVLFAEDQMLIPLGAMLFMLGLVLLAPALVRPFALLFGALVSHWLAREGTGHLAQGNLTRQPGRAAVTASTTMIALAILVVVGGTVTAVKNGMLGIIKQGLGSDYLFVPPSISVWGGNIGAHRQFADDLRAVDGVAAVSSLRYAAGVAAVQPAMPAKGQPAPNPDGMPISVMGIDPLTFPVVSGMRFDRGAVADPYAALGAGRAMVANGIFAATAGLKVGDVVPLITPTGRHDYQVVAIASDFMNAKVITAYISHASLDQDFGKTEDIFIQLNLAPGADRASVEPALRAIRESYPQFSMISGEAYYQQFVDLFTLAFGSMFVVFIFLTVPSLIAMLNTLAIGVLERTREIGMLRAVGATRRQVRRMVVAEALLLALVGTFFGLLAGIYLCYAMITAFSLAGLPVSFYFPWLGLAYAALVGIAFGLLAAILPARQAARLQIVQALRYE